MVERRLGKAFQSTQGLTAPKRHRKFCTLRGYPYVSTYHCACVGSEMTARTEEDSYNLCFLSLNKNILRARFEALELG